MHNRSASVPSGCGNLEDDPSNCGKCGNKASCINGFTLREHPSPHKWRIGLTNYLMYQQIFSAPMPKSAPKAAALTAPPTPPMPPSKRPW